MGDTDDDDDDDDDGNDCLLAGSMKSQEQKINLIQPRI